MPGSCVIQEQKHAAHMLQACGLGSSQSRCPRLGFGLRVAGLGFRGSGTSVPSAGPSAELGRYRIVQVYLAHKKHPPP
jgi:hypothetical protein